MWSMTRKSCDLACELHTPSTSGGDWSLFVRPHPRWPAIAGIDGLSIDTIELYERNMIDELALRLVHGELPVGS
jgi:hypothetical protein